MRFLIAACVGVVATLAWQSYGDTARQIIANSHPQLSWLAPEAAVAQNRPVPTLVNRRHPSRQEVCVVIRMHETAQRPFRDPDPDREDREQNDKKSGRASSAPLPKFLIHCGTRT